MNCPSCEMKLEQVDVRIDIGNYAKSSFDNTWDYESIPRHVGYYCHECGYELSSLPRGIKKLQGKN